nr:putative UPF0481 protein At3g02645 [Coffea arabica]
MDNIRELFELKLFERVETIASRTRERFCYLVFGIKIIKRQGKDIFGFQPNNSLLGKNSFQPEDYVNKLLFSLYNLDSYSRHKSIDKFLHVLDICHGVLLLPSGASHRHRKIWPSWVLEKTIPSATELHGAGIQMQRSRSLHYIGFYKGVFCVTLKVPVIVVDNITETFFLNLLAFERLQVGAGREVTNYLAFMNNIIRDSKDISLIRSCGIIQNSLGKDEVVADLFNSLTKDVTIDTELDLYGR